MNTLMEDFLVSVERNDSLTRPWPRNGEQFVAYVAVLPEEDADDDMRAWWINPPDSVQEVMSDVGTIGVLSEELFQIGACVELQTAGLYRVKLAFFTECSTDWESGHQECENGFSILTTEKVPA
jgi:hypothetical protein